MSLEHDDAHAERDRLIRSLGDQGLSLGQIGQHPRVRLSAQAVSEILTQTQEDEFYALDAFKEDDDPDDGLDTLALWRAGRLRGAAASEARRRYAEHNARWEAMNQAGSAVKRPR